MPSNSTIQPHAVPIRNGVIALSGYAIRVCVSSRELHVEDGTGTKRRRGRFAKAPTKLKRLLIMGQTGSVTLEALSWLDAAGAAFLQLDYDAAIMTASMRGLDDARLRRAQALVPLTDHSMKMVKALLKPKIHNQAAVLDSFGLPRSEMMDRMCTAATEAETIEALLQAERQGANAYWDAWSTVSPQFAKRGHVPDHWRTFGARRSPLTSSARNAANPINALLNYLYALLEVETRLALIARGLDPGLGLFHLDFPNRQSLATDVMEPVRPYVDAYVLKLIRTRTFAAHDFFEMRDGGCRLTSTLTHELAATMPEWAKLVEPYAEHLARDITQLAKDGLGVVTQSAPNKRASIRVRSALIKSPEIPTAKSTIPITAVHNACLDCGVPVNVGSRIYCDACWRINQDAHLKANVKKFSNAGAEKLAKMRAAGQDPSHTTEAKSQRAETLSKQRAAKSLWEDDGSLDDIDFARDILPLLEYVPLKKIAQAVDISTTYASKVRLGQKVPHPRHWKALKELGESQPA